MRKTCILTMALALIITWNLKGQIDERQLYEHKIEAYTKTRNTGRILLYTGTLVTAIGVGCIFSLLSDADNYNDNYMKSPEYTIGVYGTGLGLDMIIGGIILNSVGTRKVIQYTRKLQNLSAGISLKPGSKGFSLTYRF